MATTKTPVWFITGASSGFGLSITHNALSRGHKVVAVGRRISALQPLADAGATIMELDVTSPESVLIPKIQQAADAYGYITHVINAAGYILAGVNEGISEEEAERHMATDVLGLMKIAKLVTPYLRKEEKSAMANFGSVGSWTAVPGVAHYAAAKHAVSGFSRSLTMELAPFGVSVVCIEPGYFRTSFLNDGVIVYAKERLEDVYGGTPGDAFRTIGPAVNNKQPGNVDKAGPLIVDLMTQSGSCEGREIPERLLLGSDCFRDVKEYLATNDKAMEDWKDIILSTDHDDAKQQ